MAKRQPTAAERAHMGWVAMLPCLACGDRATVHHVTGYAHVMGRLTRSHRLVVPLCPPHHQKVFDPCAAHPVSVEGLGHRGFYQEHGIDLFAEAQKLEAESVAFGRLPRLAA